MNLSFGIGWGTLAGSAMLLILLFVMWKIRKEVIREKNRLSEMGARKNANTTLNKIKKSGKSATDVLKDLKAIQDRANRKKGK